MTTLLHVAASPRGAASESRAIAETFLEAYGMTHPGDEVVEWDLWDGTLPAFGPPAAAAKMAVFAGAEPQGDAARAWRAAIDAFRRFDAADGYLFSVPMWNAGVPYILSADFQRPFFDDWLRWAGIDDITSIDFRPDLATADADTGRRAAHAAARDAGKTF
ncbi:MAG: hypothetical protein K0R87_2996 [Pseudonocardia sp.]|nr:hypothetical protein [Pseudonocardia sp.]